MEREQDVLENWPPWFDVRLLLLGSAISGVSASPSISVWFIINIIINIIISIAALNRPANVV